MTKFNMNHTSIAHKKKSLWLQAQLLKAIETFEQRTTLGFFLNLRKTESDMLLLQKTLTLWTKKLTYQNTTLFYFLNLSEETVQYRNEMTVKTRNNLDANAT